MRHIKLNLIGQGLGRDSKYITYVIYLFNIVSVEAY